MKQRKITRTYKIDPKIYKKFRLLCVERDTSPSGEIAKFVAKFVEKENK